MDGLSVAIFPRYIHQAILVKAIECGKSSTADRFILLQYKLYGPVLIKWLGIGWTIESHIYASTSGAPLTLIQIWISNYTL